MSERQEAMARAQQAAGDVFNAGAKAALRAIFANVSLREAGFDGGLPENLAECVRYARQKVWGKDAYDYTPKRKRPVAWSKWYAINKSAIRKRKEAP